ncbi:MAG TPA: integrase core domain-containing protein, partial [Aggregatilineaceae bacterium]|nr:integrase core domain-containing protein [Aggregatilineaceae bacterium]
LVQQIKSCVVRVVRNLEQRFQQWPKPNNEFLVAGTLADVTRGKGELITENALLRHQVIILQRQTKRPQLTQRDRGVLVLLARWVRHWKDALAIVKPDTLLGWHRQGFRLYWRRKSRTTTRQPRIAQETIDLIKQMAVENRLWGAKRIRGELRKLGIRVSKRTIQRYMRQARQALPPRTSGQTWATFLKNHAHEIWACDFLQVYDLLFRPMFAFFIVELGSRRMVHIGVTRSPSDAWVAQQLREATPFGTGPKYLIRDNDDKYGPQFKRVAAGIKVLKTPVRAPKANAVCERFLGSVRRECLDHFLILSEGHLRHILTAYVAYFNLARPHQGIGQQMPRVGNPAALPDLLGQPVRSYPVLGGLHHNYRRVA